MSFSPIWPTVAVPQKSAADQIHVWAWQFDTTLGLPALEEAQIGLLDVQELERFHRFHFACDRARFAIAHVNVRRILGAYRIESRSPKFKLSELTTLPNTTMPDSPALWAICSGQVVALQQAGSEARTCSLRQSLDSARDGHTNEAVVLRPACQSCSKPVLAPRPS